MGKADASPARGQQIAAVARKLVELNPKFDGKVTGPFGKGAAQNREWRGREFEFVTDDVTDISPVRALAGLKVPELSGGSSAMASLPTCRPLQGNGIHFVDVHTPRRFRPFAASKGCHSRRFFCGFTNASVRPEDPFSVT